MVSRHVPSLACAIAAALLIVAPAARAADAAGDTLTFADALARVIATGPALRAAPARTDVARAAAAQAAARPNPTVAVEAENLGGSYQGFDYAELTILLTQEFELGGRRGARIAAAREAARVAGFDARTDTLALQRETRRRYFDVVHAEERHRIAMRAGALVAELVAAADARVAAGAGLRSDRALAAAAAARARLATELADGARSRARAALALLWGGVSFADPVAKDIPLPVAVPAPDSATRWARESPAVVRARLAAAALQADHAVEKSLRVPSLSASVGARRVEFDDAGTFLVGLSLPLPLWDRRAEAVHAAGARVRAAELEAARLQAEVAGQLAAHLQMLAQLVAQTQRVDAEVIPELGAAAEGLRAAYRLGSASYPDLLEVERALVAMEQEQSDTRRAIVDEIVAIEELTGRNFEEMGNE